LTQKTSKSGEIGGEKILGTISLPRGDMERSQETELTEEEGFSSTGGKSVSLSFGRKQGRVKERLCRIVAITIIRRKEG